MLKKLYLYGDLAEKYGAVHSFHIDSVGEAMRAMEANYPGFRNSIDRRAHYNVVRGETLAEGEALDEDTIVMKFKKGDFHIAPAVIGAKAGVLQTILGAVLVVIGIIMLYTPAAAFGPAVIKLGVALMLTGIAVMLTPVPETGYGDNEDPNQRRGFLFDGPTNTTEQGGVIPLIYGRMLVGSTIISTSIDIQDVTPLVDNPQEEN